MSVSSISYGHEARRRRRHEGERTGLVGPIRRYERLAHHLDGDFQALVRKGLVVLAHELDVLAPALGEDGGDVELARVLADAASALLLARE